MDRKRETHLHHDDDAAHEFITDLAGKLWVDGWIVYWPANAKGCEMADSKSSMQIPEQVKEMVEKAIEQTEQAVFSLIEAAEKSASMVPNPTTDLSKKLLSMGAQNMNAAFDHARNLLRCGDLHEAANLQARFLNAQFETASRQLKELYGTRSSDVETAKTSIEIK